MSVTAQKPNRADCDESALIERVCNGDKDAFYGLIEPYQRAVFLAAYSILQNEGDAEEGAQEAILKALVHLPGFRRESVHHATGVRVRELPVKIENLLA